MSFKISGRRRCAATVAIAFLSCSGSAIACALTARQVQDEALALLAREQPQRRFQAGSAVDVIVAGEAELGLQSLRSKLCLGKAVDDKGLREEVMREHFDAQLRGIDSALGAMPTTWAEAQEKVILQLMPSDYLRPFKGVRVLVTRSFVAGVELAVVIDRERGYAYVRDEDRQRWGIAEKQLFDTALKNLDLKKRDVKLQGGRGRDRFLASEEKDGYDAARLLVPWVREEAARFLGNPFLAGIPNRDFLIMWSEKNSAEFQTKARVNVRDDFNVQPYPLAPITLRVWADGRVEAFQ